MTKVESALETLIWQALNLYPIESIHPLLDDPTAIVRDAAIRALHVRGGRPEFELALGMLRSKKWGVRELGAFLLGQLGTPQLPFKEESAVLLEQLLERDPSTQVRASAAAALGHLGQSSSVPFLIKASQSSSRTVRAQVAAALHRFPNNSKARAVLAKLRQDADSEVQYWAK